MCETLWHDEMVAFVTVGAPFRWDFMEIGTCGDVLLNALLFLWAFQMMDSGGEDGLDVCSSGHWEWTGQELVVVLQRGENEVSEKEYN